METEKLNSCVVPEVLNAMHKYQELVSAIEARMDYIVKYVCEKGGAKLDYWSWQNSSEDIPMGDFESSYRENSDHISVHIDWSKANKMIFLDHFDNEVDLSWGEFPARWLFEDFEKEFTDGLVKYEVAKKEKAEKARVKKLTKAEEKKKLIEIVKTKLTDAERKALGL